MNNSDTIAYVNNTNMGIYQHGTVLQPGRTIDQWKVDAGFDWEIKTKPVQFTVEKPIDPYGLNNGMLQDTITMDDRVVLHRSDDNTPLAVMSDRYQVVQPGEILEFYRDLTESNGMQLELAGSVKGGRTLWALASNPEQTINLGGVDIVAPYLMLATSCDGTLATRVVKTSVRQVCNNMLSMVSKGNSMMTIKHSTKFDAQKIHESLGISNEIVSDFAGMADDLASKGMTNDQAGRYFIDLYKKENDQGELTNEKSLEKTVTACMQAFTQGPGAQLVTARQTQWGALNAVTNYQDHTTPARSDENRFNSAQFGQGADIKARAVELLTSERYQISANDAGIPDLRSIVA